MRPKLFAFIALATLAACIIAAEWPRSATQAADEPIPQPLKSKTAATNAAAAKSTSPNESPNAIYAEYAAAVAAGEYSRAIACLSPDQQAVYAFRAIASALQHEFEPQSQEALQRVLAGHGLDLMKLPPEVAEFIDERAWHDPQAEVRWREIVVERIRDVPGLLRDLEELEAQVRKAKPDVPYVPVYPEFAGVRYGLLRGLVIKDDTATANTRVKGKASSYAYNPPGLEATVKVKLSFARIDGNWYLSKFEQTPPEAPADGSPVAPPSSPPPSDATLGSAAPASPPAYPYGRTDYHLDFPIELSTPDAPAGLNAAPVDRPRSVIEGNPPPDDALLKEFSRQLKENAPNR